MYKIYSFIGYNRVLSAMFRSHAQNASVSCLQVDKKNTGANRYRFLLVCALLLVTISTFAQNITLSKKDAFIGDVFKELKKQSGYDFVYKSDVLNTAHRVTVDVRNLPLKQVLDKCFEGQPLSYKIQQKTIIVIKKAEAVSPAPAGTAENNVVHGHVYDEKSEPLAGATIRIIGSFSSAVTDDKGGYVIMDPPAAGRLVVSFVGYKTDTTAIDGRNEINIFLKLSATEMHEVTVSTGYQTLNKERATGSFAKPDMQVFSQRVGTNNILSRLDGLIPGLTIINGPAGVVTNRNGNGQTNQISYIRGKSSINVSSDPLYVVNGVQVTDISSINPDDVGDVTVLKDAAAAAIWGAKAANGVIVITTKQGRKNEKIKINYNGYFNFQGKPNLDYMHVMNSAQYIQAARETFDPVTYPYSSLNTQFVSPHEQILYDQSRGLLTSAQANNKLDSLAGINNLDQVKDLWYRNAYTMNHTVSASGGGNAYTFYSSLSYTDNQSNQLGAKNNAYRIMFNQSFSPNNRIKISLNTMLNNTVSSQARPISIEANFLPYQLFQDPAGNNLNMNYVQGYTAATRADYQARSRINLDYVPMNDLNAGYTNMNVLAANINSDVTVKLWKGLSFEGTYGYQKTPGTAISYDDISEYKMRSQLLAYTVAPSTASTPVYYLPNTGGKYLTSNNDARNWTVRNQLQYRTSLRSDKDNLNIQIGQEANEQLSKSNATTVYGYNPDLQTYPLLNYAQLSQGVFGTVSTGRSVFSELPFTSTEIKTRFTSYFGLLSYNFDGKYSFDGSIRADKSNLFGSENSGQKKPAYSFGMKWLMNKENFMKDVNWLNDLGLRATYGITGNSPFLGYGSTMDILLAETNTATGNALSLYTPKNNKLTWEATHTFNFGIDFAVLDYKLSGSIDVYTKKTTDLLGTVQSNAFTGYSAYSGNLGNLANRGFEVRLNSANIAVKDFRWTTTFTFSYNWNKLLSYSNPTTNGINGRLSTDNIIGYPIPGVFAYRYAGLDNLGDPQIRLANGTVTKNPRAATRNDLVFMGTTIPKYSGGLSNTFAYKGISLTANMIYNLGAVMRRDVNTLYTGRLTGSIGSFGGNQNSEFANRWKKPGDEAFTNIPSFVANQGTSSRRNIDYYTGADINVVSASYLKLRDITLAYSLPHKITDILKISSANIFVQSGNYLLWKANKYGIDPEYNAFDSGTQLLPPYKHSYSLGLNVTF